MLRAIKMKQAELPINVLIVLVLSLIVFAIVVIMFLNKTGEQTENYNSCETKGGSCVKSAEECGYSAAQFKCPEKMVCCLNTQRIT